MKSLLILCLSLFALSFVPSRQLTVYVCGNGKTEVYHVNKNCTALKRCSHEHLTMSLSTAKGKGLRICGLED